MGAIDIRNLPYPIRVVEAKPLSGFRLELSFEVGEEKKAERGVFDMSGYLDWPAFASLGDKEKFDEVFSDGFTACWPGDVDISPERLWTDSEGTSFKET